MARSYTGHYLGKWVEDSNLNSTALANTNYQTGQISQTRLFRLGLKLFIDRRVNFGPIPDY